MIPERVRVVVIGGGVIGCAILWEFARRGVPGVLIEAEPDVCEGTSKANSAILHTGFDSRPGSVESRLLRRAAELWPATIDELGVPFLAVGALMLARTGDDVRRLRDQIAAGATALGVRTELLDRPALRDVAPYLAPDVTAALSIPDEGALDPFWLTRAFAEAAMAGGARVVLGRAVVGLEVGDRAATVRLDDGALIRAEQVVDAAGLRADDVARLAGDDSFMITPRKGQFLVSEEAFGVDRIVLPIPGPMGKGMLVTPIVFGGLLLGPTAVDGADKDDRSVDPAERERILAACGTMVPAVAEMIPIRQFAGLRHVSSTGDFIVRPSTAGDRLYLAAGIRSTGISTSPAVAEAVVTDVLARRGWRSPSRSRPLAPPPTTFPDQPGEVVCPCRSISRAEIEAACRRPTAPRTLDAIKRRAGATFGDCQGNLCALDVARIVARERGIPLGAIEKHRRGSWLWEATGLDGGNDDDRGKVPGDDRGGDRGDLPDAASAAGLAIGTALDLIVIGGGQAGRAAADAAAAAGRRALVVERNERRRTGQDAAVAWMTGTVVGVSQVDAGWLVLAQAAAGTVELEAPVVIVATGAYVEPREHRAVAGPRPAGIITADLSWRILETGLRPGRAVALAGVGRRADELAAALVAAGARVERVERAPDEVRGEARLEAVRLGTRWLPVDTLVLADRLLPQTFVLRGLGLIDGRPGTPLPVDADGRLPLDGLWAAGCCVVPSVDHEACAAAGGAVGRRAAGSPVSRWAAGGARQQGRVPQ